MKRAKVNLALSACYNTLCSIVGGLIVSTFGFGLPLYIGS